MDDNMYLEEQDFDMDTDDGMEATFAFNPEDDDLQMLAQRDQMYPGAPGRPPYNRPPQYDRYDRYDRDRYDRDRYDRRGGFPTTPPPSYIPRRPFPYRNPYPLRQCLYGFDYLWMNDGRGFWARLTRVTGGIVEGHRWDGFRWRPFTANIRDINNYVCL